MTTIRLSGWKVWRQRLSHYATLSRQERGRIIFRGQASADWKLEPTLDRGRQEPFRDDDERDRLFNEMMSEFRREAFCVVPDPASLPKFDEFELLARHHGVPSKFLDWTESPFIASFFAFESATPTRGSRVAIWELNLSDFAANGGVPGVDLVDNFELIRSNRRALRQRGVFTRITTSRLPVEELLGATLTKTTITASDRRDALAELDEMSVNAATLFGDLDGAARTARARLDY